MLRLLEAQHEKIARIIKSHNTAQLNEAIAETTTTADIEGAKDDAEASATTSNATGDTATPKKTSTTSAIAAARLNARARESSPSLARDIASRRGIRPQGNASSQAALTRSRQVSPESQRRKNAVAPRIPPSIMESSATLPAKKAHSKADDEGFATFYNSLTTGTMSKLSSVLAYAGLPLTAEEPQNRSEASQTPQASVEKSRKDRSSSSSSSSRTVNATTEPDVKKYISKAALSAIEDDHRQRGSHGQVFGPAESFYVVQKGGGTYSYADIARNQQLHNAAAARGEDEESFVDAQEVVSPGSSSGGGGISSPRHSRAAFGKSRTAEELELENTTLKTTLEQLASRLSNFEVHAQDASMAAIAQSMASLHNSPHALPPKRSSAAAATTTASATGDSAHSLQDALGRVRALEAQLTSQAEQHEKLEALAQKQERKIRMYHSKWEDVKKSAREKEKVKREKAEAEAAGKTGGSGGG